MITETIGSITIVLPETEGLFSPRGLDRGTRAMLELYPPEPGWRVLDLGCGAGPVGIYAAKICGAENVVMADIDPRAVSAAARNAGANGLTIAAFVSDGFRQLPETGFDVIYSNPPYQSDFAVARHFIEKGFNRLNIGGRLFMVTKRRAWYENKLRAIFGGCRVTERDGYFVFSAQKRSARYANARPSK